MEVDYSLPSWQAGSLEHGNEGGGCPASSGP